MGGIKTRQIERKIIKKILDGRARRETSIAEAREGYKEPAVENSPGAEASLRRDESIRRSRQYLYPPERSSLLLCKARPCTSVCEKFHLSLVIYYFHILRLPVLGVRITFCMQVKVASANGVDFA